MPDLSIDLTNVCNRDCIHCLRDKLEPRKHLPLDVFIEILDSAYSFGITHISLTGGEPTLHPAWPDMLVALAERKLKFSFVSNGYQFKQRTLPVLSNPMVKRYLDSICLSLDGASPTSHNTLRGNDSFSEVIDAANLSRLQGLPLSFKTVVTNANIQEIIEIALLGSKLGANQHSFLTLVPTPRLLENNLLPSHEETKQIFLFIKSDIIPNIKTEIMIEGSWGEDSALFNCNAYQQSYSIDHLGNAVFCCNLSHVCNGNKPSIMGKEMLGSVNVEGLEKCIARHYELLSKFTSVRLSSMSDQNCLYPYPCLWCLDYFGKLTWKKELCEKA